MKILFPIGTIYPSQQGGPSNTVYWMAKALTRAGIEVIIAATHLGAGKKVPADTWIKTDYGQVIYHTAFYHLLPRKLLRTVWKTMPQCDMVHLTSLFYPPSVLSALMAKWHKKPVIWSPRGELDEKALVYSTWKKKPFLWLIRRYFADKVIFHSTSPEETGRINTILGSGLQVIEIPNLMELPSPVQPATAENYFLCIGRVHPKKALENLIAALPLAKQFLQSDFTLIIAGDDRNDYGMRLREQVATLGLKHKVTFVGQVEGEDKERLYAGAYFSILPSHTENFGNVVMESLAQGTPVIASTGTPWQILTAEKAGMWTDNDPSSLAHDIDKAMNFSPDTYRSYRKNALALARNRFEVYENIHRWIDIYRCIINNLSTV